MLQFADAGEMDSASRAFVGSSRDEAALTLQIPSDGGVQSLRSLIDRLDAESLAVKELSVHMPDLDDVFLALTGQADTDRNTVR